MLPAGLPRISGRADWLMAFPAEASLQRLEGATTSFKVQTPMQDYKDHEELGNHGTAKGTK